jgi:hypothetical protein
LEFEGLPLIQRRALIEELAAILKNGSDGIAPYLKQHGVIFSQVEVSGEDQPYWLSQALLPLKRSQHPERSDTEVSAIANAVQLREGTFSISSARGLFGVHLTSQKVPQYLRSEVSDEAYETLMTALDHHVASTFDAKTRFALLQDKVLFGLLRLTQHSSESLANLKIVAVPECCEDEVNFETEPRTAQQALARLSWHVHRLRPSLETACQYPNVFLSPHTGRPIGATAIHSRFKSAVRRSFLTASIVRMQDFKSRHSQ